MSQEVTFIGTGDCGPVHGPADGFPVERYTELVRPVLAGVDLRFANCERQYSSRGTGNELAPHGRQPPEMAQIFTDCGFDAVTIANNHMYDYGPEALLDTRALLIGKGIKVTGAGRNLAEAREPAIVEKNGIKVGFLGYCSVIPAGGEAGPAKAGIAPLRVKTDYEPRGPHAPVRVLTGPEEQDLKMILEDVAALKQARGYRDPGVSLGRHLGAAGDRGLPGERGPRLHRRRRGHGAGASRARAEGDRDVQGQGDLLQPEQFLHDEAVSLAEVAGRAVEARGAAQPRRPESRDAAPAVRPRRAALAARQGGFHPLRGEGGVVPADDDRRVVPSRSAAPGRPAFRRHGAATWNGCRRDSTTASRYGATRWSSPQRKKPWGGQPDVGGTQHGGPHPAAPGRLCRGTRLRHAAAGGRARRESAGDRHAGRARGRLRRRAVPDRAQDGRAHAGRRRRHRRRHGDEDHARYGRFRQRHDRALRRAERRLPLAGQRRRPSERRGDARARRRGARTDRRPRSHRRGGAGLRDLSEALRRHRQERVRLRELRLPGRRGRFGKAARSAAREHRGSRLDGRRAEQRAEAGAHRPPVDVEGGDRGPCRQGRRVRRDARARGHERAVPAVRRQLGLVRPCRRQALLARHDGRRENAVQDTRYDDQAALVLRDHDLVDPRRGEGGVRVEGARGRRRACHRGSLRDRQGRHGHRRAPLESRLQGDCRSQHPVRGGGGAHGRHGHAHAVRRRASRRARSCARCSRGSRW